MVFKLPFATSFFLFLFLTMPFFIFTQEQNFFLDTTGPEPRIHQRLAWSEDDYVLHYEIIIEREEAVFPGAPSVFREVQRETTENTYLLVSLPVGRYRFRVIPYNLLGQAGESSPWRSFNIRQAHIPYIEKFFPNAFFMEFIAVDRVLDIAGYNFLPVSQISLRREGGSLYPVEAHIHNRRRATLFFDDNELIPGVYDIYIVNPGGFDAFLGPFIVGYRSPLHVILKTAWTPIIPIHGDIKNTLGSNLFLSGITNSLELLTTRRGIINGGVEFFHSMLFLNPAVQFRIGYENIWEGFVNADTGAFIMDFAVNAVFQRRFMLGQMTFSARGGFGVTYLNGFGDFSKTNGQGYSGDLYLSTHAGISISYFIHDIFFIEPGVDASLIFSDPLNWLLKPRLSFGWRF